MQAIGNINSNRIYNPNEIRNPPPPNLEESERDSEIEQFIRGEQRNSHYNPSFFFIAFCLFFKLFFLAKYEYKKFFDKSALVASKLGQSRPAPRPLAQTPPAATLPQPIPLPRSSAHTTKPLVAASSASTSSYTAPPQQPPQMIITQPALPPQPSGGVWDDIKSLKGNIGQNSSLPLQYQQPTYPQGNSMQVNGALGANTNYFGGVQTSGMGLNPYQPDQVRTNPFSQQLSSPSFSPSSISSTFPTTPTMNSQHFGDQPFGVPQSSVSSPVSPPYYNPQPQTSLQIQNSSSQRFISESTNQLYPSSPQPIGQPQYSPQSHNPIPLQQQYISRSPQPVMQSSPNTPFMYQSPGPAQSQQLLGGHNVSTQRPFLGMTTMEMQQQQMQMQLQQQQQQQQQQMQMQQQQMQQQQMQQHQQQIHQQHQPQLGQNYYPSMQPQILPRQVNNIYSQTPVYTQSIFPPGGGQWGNTM